MAKSSIFRIRLARLIRADLSFGFFFLVLLSYSLQARTARAQTAPDEVEALKQIAAKLKIPKTLWHFDVDPCTEWERVAGNPYVHNITCKEISLTAPNATANDTFLHVTGIEIKAADLTGVLPEEIGKLKYLTWIDLSRNYINGTIPAANWTSVPLTNLNLLANRISGVIPDEIGQIKTLETLFIESNLLYGSLPPSLGNLTNLKRLLLSCNNFSGTLPEAMSNMKNITEIRLDSTEISGKIPRFFGNFTKLRRLDLQGTAMEGPFPPEFGSLLKMAELRVSDLKNVGGAFPPMEKMPDMQQLVLRNCSLSGRIPEYIGKFEQLQTLDLSFNNLTGEIPTSLQNLGLLTTMFLTSNKLTGTIPGWVKKPQQNMDISYNSFTDLASAPPNCEQETRNYVASFPSTTTGNIPSCLLEGMPCSGTPKNYELFINCGGESVIVDGKEYERDIAIEGISKYFLSPSGKWAYSSTGNFVGGSQQKFTAQSGSALTMQNAQLYMSARLNPLSLKYYGLCLQRGNYTVKLHFAEIIFLPGPTYWSLGRRVFDVSIQGKKVLEDFNIAQAANGIGNEIVLNFTVPVENGTLEIHLEWAGKGTNSIPYRSVYGPLISAISVTPNFKPRIFKDHKLSVRASIGIAIASTALAMTVILGVIWFFLRKKAREENELEGLDFQNCYRLKQIKAATGNFDPKNKIGEGGFGPVYKGVLPDGSMIAVKQLSSKSKQGNREFITEVGMISGLDHPNLVRLYGCCVEGHQLLLIYEYMENNCLARALFGPESARLKLDWATRRKICVGVARGLAYLHGESRLKIIHRDIKATNVLLDKDLNAKISDFGLAKLDEEEDTHISTRIAGTMGYMAPEYAMRGYLTDKADVYSFGVVVLELVSGKNNTSFLPKEEFMFLLDWAYVLEKKGNLLELVDPALGGKFNVEEAQLLLNLGILCASPSPALRPPMANVVAMLEGHMPVEIPDVEFSMAESMELGFRSSGILSSNDYGNSQSMSLPAIEENFVSSPAQSNFHSATSRLLAEQDHLRQVDTSAESRTLTC